MLLCACVCVRVGKIERGCVIDAERPKACQNMGGMILCKASRLKCVSISQPLFTGFD